MAFKPGQSGNPSGRPVGAKNKRLELMRSHDRKLQRKVIDMAMAGDTAALKIVADRLWPRLRSQPLPVSIDADSGDLAGVGRKAIDQALAGEVTVDALREILGALYLQGQIVELTEFEARLQALEERSDVPPWEPKPTAVKLPLRRKKRDEERS